jgi:hypothetical protein
MPWPCLRHAARSGERETSNVGSGNRLSFQAGGLHAVVDRAIRAIQPYVGEDRGEHS